MNVRDMVPWKNKTGALSRHDDPFNAIQHRMNTLFEDFFDRSLQERTSFVPRIDVADKEKEIQVSAELPGMDEKDIDVTVDDNMLTIRGEKSDESKEEGDDYYHVERSFGSFRRTIPLSASVDRDKVKATFKKGVLKIALPKTEATQKRARKVEIES